MKNQEASTIKDVLINQWIYRHGNPKIAVNDQARNIDGKVVSALCTELGIEKWRSSPCHPEGDVQAECSVQMVKAILQCIMYEEGKASYTWPSLLEEVAFKANTATNASSKYTPYEVMYGMKAKIPSSICTPVDTEGAGVWRDCRGDKSPVREHMEECCPKFGSGNARYTAQYGKDRKHKDVQMGDWAYVRNQSALEPVYHGPYEVVSVMGPDIQVRDPIIGLRVIH